MSIHDDCEWYLKDQDSCLNYWHYFGTIGKTSEFKKCIKEELKEKGIADLTERYIINICGSFIDLETKKFFNEHEAACKLNKYETILKPIRDVCEKYNIPLEDLPDVLEEYIAYDNAEYLEKLQNQ